MTQPSSPADSGQLSVELTDIWKTFPGVVANAGVELAVRRRSIHALLGENGAGKSTLVDLIVGLVESTEGTILVDEVSLADLDLSQWRRSIGYVAQETLLLDGSVATNIAWGCLFYTSPSPRDGLLSRMPTSA